MLEIRNVSKVYRSKTGEEVRALDNVSISFPESGMVFILGKSGSGKSTLLNVMGGLDSYDSGEFVIKGKSSNDFVGSDFDAYRNTFIGFIFQEYNVLDDFTVGANIGLALELQGKKATDEAINSILAQVDLLNYAKRKPNELSGGQKQRVAIARALVKDPQIIMADEPTGALDSNTGKQIFDTLKELSKEKLVLIVSHDRDFAERYADRIIEMADGHVIEDVTKHEHQAERVSAGVHRINDNILRIESGYRLTAADLEMINAYLAKNQGDVLLSGDGRVNDELRSAAGISKDGGTTVFEGTDPEKDIKSKKYEKNEAKFIRSRLPMKNAIKMGSSGLKHKKFRLFMTILLSFVSFAMFGLASTVAAYDSISSATASVIDSNVRNASVTVSVRRTTTYDDGDVYHYYEPSGINEEDIAYLSQQTGLNFVPVYTGSPYPKQGGFSVTNHMEAYESNTVYTGSLSGLVTMTREEFNKTGFQLTGEWPDAKGEILITELMYRQFNEYGYKGEKVNIQPGALTMDDASATGIIGKQLVLSNRYGGSEAQKLTIVGVVDTGFDYTRYDKFLPEDENDRPTDDEDSLFDMVLAQELSYEISFGFHALAFATAETVNEIVSSSASHYVEIGTYMDGWNSRMNIVLTMAMSEGEKGEGDEQTRELYKIATLDDVPTTWPIEWLDGRENGTLGENEILVNADFKNWIQPHETTVELTDDKLQVLINGVGADNWAASENPNYVPGDSSSEAPRSFRERLELSLALKYIDDQLQNTAVANAVKSDAANDLAYINQGGDVNDPAAYWHFKWFINVQAWYTPTVDGMELFTRSDARTAGYSAVVIPFLNGLYGLELPADMTYDELNSMVYATLNECWDNDREITVEYSSLAYQLRSAYSNYDARKNNLLANQQLVALLIEKEYNGVDSLESWNNQAENQEWMIRSFYADWYCSGSEYEELYGKNGLPVPSMTNTQSYMVGSKAVLTLSGKTIENLLAAIGVKVSITNHETGTDSTVSDKNLTIAGFFQAPSQYDYQSIAVVSEAFETYAKNWQKEERAQYMDHGYTEDRADHTDGIWGFAIAPMPNDADVVEKLAMMHYAEEGTVDLKFEMNNAVMATLGQFDDIIEVISQVFVWVGLGLAIFSSFLLMNFISTSISYKKREIGILRAVGARSSDVFKIFFSEAFIIAIINFVLAVVASLTTVLILNNYMRNQGINITLLKFGPVQVLLMLGISILVAALASFLPVWKIARKKPVDAIKDR
ncbi:MAG: ABC transporter ATP-binding protein/permease [Clostridia bacterium]|nr:ABC transporter ATP-binding protein/permease [Clostridia bacterium]